MRKDQIKKQYERNIDKIKKIAKDLENYINVILEEREHIDKITSRAKSVQSFVDKTQNKLKNGKLKYEKPFEEIQDIIGCRIVIYYKNDIKVVSRIIEKEFNRVEKKLFVQDDAKRFDYEGLHYIFFIPMTIINKYECEFSIKYFELQIKTLYQHAWSQSEHGLGYKPSDMLSHDEERKLAFISAQSWGADEILNELIISKGKSNIFEINNT